MYTKLAELRPDDRNARIPRSVAYDEHNHSLFWKPHAGRKAAPDAFKTFGTVSLARAFAITLALAVFIIFLLNCYPAQNMSFAKRFAEMAAISLGVAGLSFGAGWLPNRLMRV